MLIRKMNREKWVSRAEKQCLEKTALFSGCFKALCTPLVSLFLTRLRLLRRVSPLKAVLAFTKLERSYLGRRRWDPSIGVKWLFFAGNLTSHTTHS